MNLVDFNINNIVSIDCLLTLGISVSSEVSSSEEHVKTIDKKAEQK